MQQRRSFARWSRFALASAMRLMVLPQARFVGQELLPRNVSGVSLLFQEAPLLARKFLTMGFTVHVLPSAGAPETKCACVSRVVQRVQCHVVRQGLPCDLPAARLTALGELQILTSESLHDGPRRAGAFEGGEKHPKALLHLLIGIEDNTSLFVVNQTDRQRHFQFGSLRFIEHSAHQTRFEYVQFGFTHCSFESQQQPVIVMRRIIEAILIEDQRVGKRTDLQKPVPVGTVTSEARNFQPHDDPRLAQSDFGNEPLKAFPFAGGLAALPLIVVDDNDAIFRPAQRYGPATQSVLALGALGIFENLA